MVLEQTGDQYGTTRLHLQNRNGSNSALFEQAGTVNLCDFGFKPGTGVQSNLRLEARVGTIRNTANNAVGEFEFFMGTTTTPAYNFSTGQGATSIELGNVGIGLLNPTQKLQIQNGDVLLSNSSGNVDSLSFQGTSTGISSFFAGAQGSTNFNYTLPITTPTANQVLAATVVTAPAITLGWSTVMTNPMTTLGDMVSGGASGVPTRLIGQTTIATRGFLTQTESGSVAAAPAWFDLFGTANTFSALQTGTAGLTISGALVSLNVSSNFNTNINTGTSTGAVAIGNSVATGITENVGTGNYSLDGTTGSTYTIGASTTTGATTIGGTAQTGTITLGSSSGTNVVNVGTGAGATTVNVATGATNAKTVHIADGAVANVVTVGSTTGAASATINSGTGGIVLVTGAATPATVTLGTTGSAVIASSTSGSDKIAIQPQSTTTTASFTGTLTSADLTAARTYTLPDASGTLSFGLASVQVLTSGTSYTTPAGVRAIVVDLVGGGGGSGGAVASTTNQWGSSAGGGGGGAYTRKVIIGPSTSYTYAIGGGGTAGTSTGGNGGAGGATTFNAGAITAQGGGGGTGDPNQNQGSSSAGGAGGAVGIGGDVMIQGGAGSPGFNARYVTVAGKGGASFLGGDAAGGVTSASGIFAGTAGSQYGGGASGTYSLWLSGGGTQANTAGAAGGAGVIIVYEYK